MGKEEKSDEVMKHDPLKEKEKSLLQRVAEMEKYIVQLEKKSEKMEQENEGLRQQVARVEEQHRTLQEQHTTLQEQHTTLQEQHTTLQKQYRTLQEQHKTLQKQLTVFLSPHVPSSKQLNREKKQKRGKEEFRKSSSSKNVRGGSKKGKEGVLWDKEADKIVPHFVNECKRCGTPVQIEQNTLDHIKRIVECPALISLDIEEHHNYKFSCPTCQTTTYAEQATLDNIALGPNFLTFITTLRVRTGASFEKIRQIVYDLTHVNFGVSTLHRGLTAVTTLLEPVKEDIGREVLTAPWLHVDETAHMLIDQGCHSVWVWVFATPSAALYVVKESRGKKVIEEVFKKYKPPDKPPPYAVCDKYGAYTHTFPLKQLCWAHILRETKELETCCEEGKTFSLLLHQRFKNLQDFTSSLLLDRVSYPIETIQEYVNTQLAPLIHFEATCDCVHKLQKRLLYDGLSYYTAAFYPVLPLTNNHAERCLRQVVLHRKQGKPFRNLSALDHYGTLLTVYETLRLRAIPIADALRHYILLTLDPFCSPPSSA